MRAGILARAEGTEIARFCGQARNQACAAENTIVAETDFTILPGQELYREQVFWGR